MPLAVTQKFSQSFSVSIAESYQLRTILMESKTCFKQWLIVHFKLKVDHKSGMSKKHKTPWITYNDDDVADSHFCIEYFNEKFSECEMCELRYDLFTRDVCVPVCVNVNVNFNVESMVTQTHRWRIGLKPIPCVTIDPVLKLT